MKVGIFVLILINPVYSTGILTIQPKTGAFAFDPKKNGVADAFNPNKNGFNDFVNNIEDKANDLFNKVFGGEMMDKILLLVGGVAIIMLLKK